MDIFGAVLGLFKQFIPDAEQRAKAEAALRDVREKFLLYTSGPLYAAYRFLVMLGAAVDVFLNAGAVGARAADNLGIDRPILGLIELLVALWPFSEKIMDLLPALLGRAVDAIFARKNGAAKPDTADLAELNARRQRETIERLRREGKLE